MKTGDFEKRVKELELELYEINLWISYTYNINTDTKKYFKLIDRRDKNRMEWSVLIKREKLNKKLKKINRT